MVNKLLMILAPLLLVPNIILAQENSMSIASDPTINSILMLVIFFIIFYLLLIRPQMKRNKEQCKMISELTKDDEIVTNSGIVGKVFKVGTNYTEIEISENVVIKIQKNSVSNILPKGSIRSN